jgi:hypothetical protein
VIHQCNRLLKYNITETAEHHNGDANSVLIFRFITVTRYIFELDMLNFT